MTKHKLFMIGGARGVGKTKLTKDVAEELKIQRIETSDLVFAYLSRNLPPSGLTEYIARQISSQDQNLVLDTHYAQHSDREEPNKQFKRGLEPADLKFLSAKFDISPCLVEVPIKELEQRRREDTRKRVLSPSFIMQDIEFNRRGYELYLTELNKEPFVLINDAYTQARSELIRWISQKSEPQVNNRFGLGTFLYIFNQSISQVLLLKLNGTKRTKFNADWGNVGGKIKYGETSLEACIREAEEEIGIKFHPDELRLLYVREIPKFFNNVHAVQFAYGALIDESKPLSLSKEVVGYQWFRLNDLPSKTLDAREEYERASRLAKESFHIV